MEAKDLLDKAKQIAYREDYDHDTNGIGIDIYEVRELMIEFAKYHVEEAVKAIVKEENPDSSQEIFEEDMKYVQNMYPLENIK